MAPRIEIKQPKLLLVEGADAYFFFIEACKAFGVNDVQVMNFGGIKELRAYLRALPMFTGYERVIAVVVARDAESDPISAVNSVKNSLRQASFPVPNDSFQLVGDSPRVAFMLLPGCEADDTASQTLLPGTLEDLCLEIVKDNSTFECVDMYIQCLQSNGYQIPRLHKTKLHSYLSGKNEFVGLKIGEASQAGAWNWEHNRLQRFKAIITTM
ncbi:MAG: DUF3226 domain-containing protein [Pseudomonadota bacterium]